MADYDLASDLEPKLGTAAAVAMAGAVFTPWIDTLDYKGVAFLAAISAVAQYGAVSWVIQQSDDSGGAGSVVAAAEEVIQYKPAVLTTTSQVFLVSWVGKTRYVRAAFNAGGAQTGQITPLLGHGMMKPPFQAALEA